MKYTIRKSLVRIVGGIWMPYGAICAIELNLSAYDIENARNENGKLTRESVERWVVTHSGDFSSVLDFYASIEDGETTVEIPWKDEENEGTYWDCMAPSYDD